MNDYDKKVQRWTARLVVFILIIALLSLIIDKVLFLYSSHYTIATVYDLAREGAYGTTTVYFYYYFKTKKHKSFAHYYSSECFIGRGEKYVVKVATTRPGINSFIKSKKIINDKVYENTDPPRYLCDTTEINEFFQKYYAKE